MSTPEAAPRSTSNPLVFFVAATGSTRPAIHSRAGGGGSINRYGTARPSSVTSRRSVQTADAVEALAAPDDAKGSAAGEKRRVDREPLRPWRQR